MLWAVRSMLMNQKHIFNKVSLNGNTYKTRFSTGQLGKRLWTDTHKNLNPAFPLEAEVRYFLIQRSR